MTKPYDINEDRKKAFARFREIGVLKRRKDIVFWSTGLNSMTKMGEGDYKKLFDYLDLIDKKEDQKQNICQKRHGGSFCQPIIFDEKFINCDQVENCRDIYFKLIR